MCPNILCTTVCNVEVSLIYMSWGSYALVHQIHTSWKDAAMFVHVGKQQIWWCSYKRAAARKNVRAGRLRKMPVSATVVKVPKKQRQLNYFLLKCSSFPSPLPQMAHTVRWAGKSICKQLLTYALTKHVQSCFVLSCFKSSWSSRRALESTWISFYWNTLPQLESI